MEILIITEPGLNWETFATWFSTTYYLPDIPCRIFCVRNKQMPYELFHWSKRLNLPITYLKRVFEHDLANNLKIMNEFRSEKATIVLTPHTIITDSFESTPDFARHNGAICTDWKSNKINELIDDCVLYDKTPENNVSFFGDAKESIELRKITDYSKGCGIWINTLKGCPFSSVSELMANEMTINEYRIMNLWKKMLALYKATQ